MGKYLKFPARININFALSSEVERLVVAMNSAFLKNEFHEIDFSDRSDHLPHITLLMGRVSSQSAFERVIEKCRIFSATNEPIAYKIGRPYWKKPSLRYLFLDVDPLDVFRQLRLNLYSQISHEIACEFHGGPKNPSHITVGYGDACRVPLEQLENMYCELHAQAITLRICEAGNRGTCRDVLASFDFPMDTSMG